MPARAAFTRPTKNVQYSATTPPGVVVDTMALIQAVLDLDARSRRLTNTVSTFSIALSFCLISTLLEERV